MIKSFYLFTLSMILFSCIQSDGVVEKYYDNGVLKEKGVLKDGKKQGVWNYWYEDETLMCTEAFRDGVLDGTRMFYFEDGSLKDSANYRMGLHVGMLKSWINKDQLNYIINYDSVGNRCGQFFIWNEQGYLNQTGSYSKGKKNGKWIDYENGLKIKEYTYKEGLKYGECVYYDENEDTLKVDFF